MDWPNQHPEWRALAAEAGIAADQIGEGATRLGRISPESSWSFARVLFPLSIGFERACKLALQVDSKLSHGEFLQIDEMRKHGHKLSGLIGSVEAMSSRRELPVTRPSTDIHEAIIDVLTGFAINGRYHHLDHLAGVSSSQDAGKMWWSKVLLPIADLHYPTEKRAFDEWMARDLGERLDQMSEVRFTHVDGSSMSSMQQVLQQGQLVSVAVPWSRVYVLQIARWLAQIMRALTNASLAKPEPSIPFLNEFFSLFDVTDSYMRSRKTWRPLT